jgi:hypothetical protein
VGASSPVGPTRHAELEGWLATRPTLPYTDDVARLWGEISAHATRRGRPRPQNDTWIAACYLAYDLPLETMNVKDFRDFAEHEGLTLPGTLMSTRGLVPYPSCGAIRGANCRQPLPVEPFTPIGRREHFLNRVP